MENTKCNQTAKSKRFNRYFVCAVLYYIFLSILSQIPGKTLSQTGIDFWDKGAHFIAYGILGALLMLGTLKKQRTTALRQLLWIAIAVTICGALDEFHQSFVPGRNTSAADLLADTLGGTVGAGIVWIVRRYPSAVLNHLRNSREKKI